MKPSEALQNHRDAVLQTARKIGAYNIRVFGSVLHGEDTDGSDLDLLVDVPRGITLLDMVRLQTSLEKQLGVSVDVLTPKDIPARFRELVVKEARALDPPAMRIVSHDAKPHPRRMKKGHIISLL